VKTVCVFSSANLTHKKRAHPTHFDRKNTPKRVEQVKILAQNASIAAADDNHHACCYIFNKGSLST